MYIPASTPDYFDPKRRLAVLVWADGTVTTDDPALSHVANPLLTYLMNQYLSPRDTEVPTHVYVGCSFCGDLHECRIERDKESQRIEDDWIYVTYVVIADMGNGHREPAFTIRLRIDGRA